MPLYPLLFSFRNVLVHGKGFAAGIIAEGRILASEEPDGMWFYGVEPVGVSAGGSDLPAAREAFKNVFLEVLFDFAACAASFDEFKRQAEGFFCSVNEPDLARWKDALVAVKSGSTAHLGLPLGDASRPCSIVIEELGTGVDSPDKNATDEVAIPDLLAA